MTAPEAIRTLPSMSAQLGTILGIWAHPDDEAYLSAGLMARAVRAGQRVVVVTATAGELGTPDPRRWPPARLARIRRREMAASLAAVGVREHRWLDYSDGGCADIPSEHAVARLSGIIDDVRPDTIVTFGPDGMTGHPDHRAVSAWATEAWRASGSDAQLWYSTVLASFHERWGAVNDQVEFFMSPEDAPSTSDDEAAAVVHCDEELLDVKFAALRAHTSQTTPYIEELGAATYRYWWATEAFVDASRVLVGAAC